MKKTRIKKIGNWRFKKVKGRWHISTGLYDKNKKEIFEGDIIKYWCGSSFETETVEYKDGGFEPLAYAGWEQNVESDECEVQENI